MKKIVEPYNGSACKSSGKPQAQLTLFEKPIHWKGEYVEDEMPKLYDTEDIPAEKKMIYQKWAIPQIGFYWFIAELDKKENIAYGYANLNDDLFAEWGYISIDELRENNTTLCREWKPCAFEEAQKKMQQYRRGLYPR